MNPPITIEQVRSPEEWNAYVCTHEYTPDTQSWGYGEFYEAMGEKAYVFGVYHADQGLIGGTLAVTVRAKRGNFLYLPYGPLLDDLSSLEPLVHYLEEFAVDEGLDFIRMSPFIVRSEESEAYFEKLGFRDAPLHMLAEHTWLLSLEQTEADLFAGMNKNHRNLIRRCDREGVRVEITDDPAKLPLFHHLLDTTARKHHFIRFSREYIDQEFIAASRFGEARLFLAYLPTGDLDAAAIIYLFGNTCAYRHGASRTLNKRLPTSYAIQWHAIREAQKNGMHFYNFWGIAPPHATSHHPFFGITHFKKGFGGYSLELTHCKDLPLSSRYWLTWGVETVRKKKRGF